MTKANPFAILSWIVVFIVSICYSKAQEKTPSSFKFGLEYSHGFIPTKDPTLRHYVLTGADFYYTLHSKFWAGMGLYYRQQNPIYEERLEAEGNASLLFSINTRLFFLEKNRRSLFLDNRALVGNPRNESTTSEQISTKHIVGIAWKIRREHRFLLGYSLDNFGAMHYGYDTNNTDGNTVYRNVSGVRRRFAHGIMLNFSF